jgi:ribosome-binding factor A
VIFDQEILKHSQTKKRPLQIAKEIKVVLSEVFLHGKIYDPILFDKTIIVSSVEVSSDLSVAKIMLMMSYPKEEKEKILKAIKKASGFFRSAVAKRLSTKVVPILHFYIDDSLEKIEKVEKIFQQINNSHGSGQGE